MKKYWLIFKISLQDVLEYRMDLFFNITRYFLVVVLMIMVWISVAKENPANQLDLKTLTNYYLITAVLFGLSNLYNSHLIERDIRLGQMAKYLTRPISVFWFYFFHELARTCITSLVKLITILPIVWLIGAKTSLQPVNFLIALTMLPLIFIFSNNFYGIISFLSFWLQDMSAIRWGIIAMVRFGAGAFVPISFLPLFYQQISFFLPFQHLAFTPTQLIINQLDWRQGLEAMLILGFWTIVASFIRQKVWLAGSRNFEGSGM